MTKKVSVWASSEATSLNKPPVACAALQCLRDAINEVSSINRPVEECIYVTVLVSPCEEIVHIPEVDTVITSPAESLILIIVSCYDIDVAVIKLKAGE